MPIQTYRCLQCNCHYESLIRTGNSELETKCPGCGSGAKEYQFSGFATKNTAIHTSERPVILVNDKGEIRYPADPSAPIHPKFLAQGYRKEYAFETFDQRNAFEKRTGKIHEDSHYDKGSNTAEKDLCPDPPTTEQMMSKIKHKIRPLGSL